MEFENYAEDILIEWAKVRIRRSSFAVFQLVPNVREIDLVIQLCPEISIFMISKI